MRTVRRHELDGAFAARQAEEFSDSLMNWAVPKLARIPARMMYVQNNSLALLGYRTVADPTAAEASTWESAVLAMHAGAAAFQVAARPAGELVDCVLGKETVPVKSAGPSLWTTGGEWLKVLFLAMVCREKERTNFLCSVSLDFLDASNQGGIPRPYLYPWIQALQLWWNDDPTYHDRLFEAVEAVDPEDERAGLLVFPVLRAFAAVADQDGEKFNDALYEGLESHRTYWTRDAERSRDPEGYIALPLLGVTCLAAETGVEIQVESDYLPKRLVAGDRVGWSPT